MGSRCRNTQPMRDSVAAPSGESKCLYQLLAEASVQYSSLNLPPGMSLRELDTPRCVRCGSNLGCDCYWDEEDADMSMSYAERCAEEKGEHDAEIERES